MFGRNLRDLRRHTTLTLVEAAEVLEALTGRSLKESSLSRWEGGYDRFAATDLFMWSQIYGVSAIALRQPQDDVTQVHVEDRALPVDEFGYDIFIFFIDPRGVFTERTRRFAERRTEGTPYVVDALSDIDDRLGSKPGLGDFAAVLLAIRDVLGEAEQFRSQLETEPTPDVLLRFLLLAHGDDASLAGVRPSDVDEIVTVMYPDPDLRRTEDQVETAR